MDLSVVIPSCNRPSVLRICLRNLVRDLPGSSEIIVVNNNDSAIVRKETAAAVKEFSARMVMTEGIVGSAFARTLGLRKARGDIILFLDDDAFVTTGYFRNLLRHFRNPQVGAVGGAEKKHRQTMAHAVWFLFRRPGSITFSGDIVSNFTPAYPRPIRVSHLHGSNFAIRSPVLREIGDFDTNLTIDGKGNNYRDETEFTHRIAKRGYLLIFEPRAVVIHRPASGGNINPERKQAWAFWYHRNTSYFFWKDIYTGNPFQAAAFLTREAAYALIRAAIYKNPYFITEYRRAIDGYKVARNA